MFFSKETFPRLFKKGKLVSRLYLLLKRELFRLFDHIIELQHATVPKRQNANHLVDHHHESLICEFVQYRGIQCGIKGGYFVQYGEKQCDRTGRHFGECSCKQNDTSHHRILGKHASKLYVYILYIYEAHNMNSKFKFSTCVYTLRKQSTIL